MSDPNMYVRIEEKEINYVPYYIIGAVIVIVIIAIGMTDPGSFGEWALVGDQPTCGSGTNIFNRQCSLGSIAKAIGRKCSDITGLGETKSEDYNISGCVIGRYIILERVVATPSVSENALNIAEIVVKAPDGTNLIDSKAVATASIPYPGYPASNLINNNLNDFAHTLNSPDFKQQWFKIDLGSDKNIGMIEVNNRTECCQSRINGTRVRVQSSSNADVFVGPTITGVDDWEIGSKLKFQFIKK